MSAELRGPAASEAGAVSPSQGAVSRALQALESAMAGWPFPAVALSALLTGGAGTVALLLLPAGAGPVGAFAADFRRWCFGQEAAGLDAGTLVLSLSSPLVLSALLLAFWGRPLKDAWRSRRARLLGASALSAALVALSGIALFVTQRPEARPGLEFPAADIRTSVPAPGFALTDHLGRPARLADLRGRVVILTAIYARCSTACPMILAETHALMEALGPAARSDVTLLGITLDPAHDTTARLAEIAAGYRLAGDARLLTGAPADVEAALDRYGFERRRDPVTGVIDHAAFFVLVDRQGRIAYRLAASSGQPHWLAEAVRLLVAESAAPVPPVL